MEDLKELKTWLTENLVCKPKISLAGPSSFTYRTKITEKQKKDMLRLGEKYELTTASEWTLADWSVTFLMENLLQWQRYTDGHETENPQRLLNFIEELAKIKHDIESFDSLMTIPLNHPFSVNRNYPS